MPSDTKAQVSSYEQRLKAISREFWANEPQTPNQLANVEKYLLRWAAAYFGAIRPHVQHQISYCQAEAVVCDLKHWERIISKQTGRRK